MANFQTRFSNLMMMMMMTMMLLLLLPLPTTGHPLPALSSEACANCSALFRSLLVNLKELLKRDEICFGITSDVVVMRSKAETLQTCAPPMNSAGCMMQTQSSFNESKCLKNIMDDLAHYHDAIDSYLKRPLRSPADETQLLKPTLDIVENLRKNCSPGGHAGSSEDASPPWGNNSFDNRQEMCKMMKGFYVRAITINRAMGYISSGDHRK